MYYRKLVSNDKAVRHSGDDRTGDSSADNKDNEVIYNKVFARYDLSGDSSFKGSTSMVMAKMNRVAGNRWTFTAIGEAVAAQDIAGTVRVIKEKYL